MEMKAKVSAGSRLRRLFQRGGWAGLKRFIHKRLSKLKIFFRNPYYVIGDWMYENHPKWMCDKWYLKVMWKKWMGYDLDLKHPKSFNEKIQWLKLYDRRPEYTMLVDKYRVKEWVADKIGAEYVVPILAVWNSVEEIDIESLPDRFVLKCNHDSRSVILCRDKSTFDLNAAKKKLSEAMTENFYWQAREWPYKHVQPLVFAEQYLEDTEDDALTDYKWFCFNGEPKIMYISRDRGRNPRTNFYDMDFQPLPIRMLDPNSDEDIPKPASFEKMKELAGILSEHFIHVRVDFYMVGGQIYFGELTFYHSAGFSPMKPEEWRMKLGSWIKLPIDQG